MPTVDCSSGLAVQQLDGNVVAIMKKWESLEALHGPLATAHMVAYKVAVAEIVDRVELKILVAI